MIRTDMLVRCDGDYCEYAHDLPTTQFRKEIRDCNDFYIISTEYGYLWITGEHQIQLENGVYKYVDQLAVGDCLKNIYCSRAIIKGITRYQGDTPYKFVKFFNKKHSYDVVEGFLVS